MLIVRQSLEKTAGVFELEESKAAELLGECRKKLFEQRLQRPKPHRDSKILTAWNGTYIYICMYVCASMCNDIACEVYNYV